MNKLLFDSKLKFRLGRHIVFFLLTVFLFTTILFLQKGEGKYANTLWLTFVNSIFFFSYAYLTIFLLIPEFLLKRKVLWFIVLFLLIGIGLSALKLVASDQIYYYAISPENVERTGILNLRYIIVNSKDMTFIVALFCIAKFIKDFIHAEHKHKILEIQTKEAQRKLFQSQFDPHFMFNTINNLYALSLLNPLKTKDVIGRIKIVLNYIIDEIQKDYVVLQHEVALVENFIQLEKLRYGERLKVEFLKEGDFNAFYIPPMILFILVENCFKHGSSLDAGSPWIKIGVKTQISKILISVENSKPEKIVRTKSSKKEHIQLHNLRKRLDIMYLPDRYQLKITDTKNTFKVDIELMK